MQSPKNGKKPNKRTKRAKKMSENGWGSGESAGGDCAHFRVHTAENKPNTIKYL